MTHELKQRVISCLNKLSDRDTLGIAVKELESIARSLTHDSFSCFISCIHNTDSSCKSPVRKQCVNLLTLLSNSHGDTLSPYLSKMVSTVIRRLRDSDSAVRSACVDATTAMSLNITQPPFSAFLKPLMETMTVEQDLNSQMGAAMCLAAAIEATPDLEAEQLRKILPRLGKLAKNESFKAKPALLTLIGSIVGAGGASNRHVLEWLVPCIVEFLGSEDWAARKAAAEALGRIAVVEKDLAAEQRVSCLVSLEGRRFDKVKIVRETMNHTLELWKEVPALSQEVSTPARSKSSSVDSLGESFSPISKSPKDVGLKTPLPRRTVRASRSPPSDSSYETPAKNGSTLKNIDSKSTRDMLLRQDHEKPCDRKLENSLPHLSSLTVPCEDYVKAREFGVSRLREKKNHGVSRPETKHILFSNTYNDTVHKHSAARSGSRVVPLYDDEIPDSEVVVCSTSEEIYENFKEVEDLSLIRKQLLQIENQQSSLLNLLQRYIGSSQSGINSLETRVHGLEMALDEISYDFAISNGRVPNSESAENTCCKLPGSEFLSSKFRRRTENRYSKPTFSSPSNQSLTDIHHKP